MPAIDMAQAMSAARRMMRLCGMPCTVVVAEDVARIGFVSTVNAVCGHLRPAHVVYAAQDALAGQDWLKAAFSRLTSRKKAVVALNDGIHNGGLAQFGLVDLGFSERHYGAGTLFFPGYRRHRADEELTHLAHEEGLFDFEPLSLMMEVDYRDTRAIDAQDTELYFQRKAARKAMSQHKPTTPTSC
jgi:hypothetical protein